MKNKQVYYVYWKDPTNYEDTVIGEDLSYRISIGTIERRGDLVYVIHGWTEDDMDYLVLHKSLIYKIKKV